MGLRRGGLFLKHPLLEVSFLFAAGIVAGDLLPGSWESTGLVAIAFLAFTVCTGRIRHCLLPAATLLCGACVLTCHKALPDPSHVSRQTGGHPILVSVEGRFLQKPYLKTFENARHERRVRAMAEFEVERIQTPESEWRPCSGRVMVRASFEPGLEFHGGSRARIFGTLVEPPEEAAPGLFNHRAYLRRFNIHRILQSQNPADWVRLGSFDAQKDVPWAERFEAWARRTLARGIDPEDDALRLTWAMALGWKTALTDEVSEPFLKTGTMHIFAISGLHVALLADILVRLLGAVRIPRVWSGIVIIPALIFYTAATGWQSSAIRAALMMSLVIGSWSLSRPANLLNSLGAAALIILGVDPQQLFLPGFQLSFLVVLGLGTLQERFRGWHESLVVLDPFLPDHLQPAWKIFARRSLGWVDQACSVSLAAWVGSLPLSCELFNLVSPSGLLINLMVVPLGDLALMCQIGSLICGDWLPSIGELFNHSAWFWMKCMMALCIEVASWPGASFRVPSPGVIHLILFYLMLTLFALNFRNPADRWKWMCLPASLLIASWFVSHRTHNSQTVITVLAMDSGYSAFVDFPGGRDDTLVNCANEDLSRRTVKQWLHAQGFNRLPLVLIQQGDLAHAGGAAILQREFQPDRFLVPAVSFRSSPYRKLSASMEQEGVLLPAAGAGQVWGPWSFLHPGRGQRIRQGDDGVLVAAMDWNNHRVIFCGNLGQEGQRACLRRNEKMRADLIIAGIPARDEGLTDAFLEGFRSSTIILVDREQQSTRATSLERRLMARGIRVWRTSTDGTLRIRFRPHNAGSPAMGVETRDQWRGRAWITF